MNDPFKIDYDIKTKQVTNMSFQQGNKDVSSIEFTVFEDGKVVDITGETIEFRFVKADRTEVFLDISSGVVIAEGIGGIVTCTLTNDVLSYPGLVKCQIFRKLGEKELFTPAFNFIVKASLGGDGLLSVNYISQVESKMIEWQAKADSLVDGYTPIKGIDYFDGEQGLPGATYDDTEVRASLANNVQQLSNIPAQDVTAYGGSGDGITDNTVFVQMALNKRGIIVVNKPGIYIVGNLKIDDNTTLILGQGVTFKLKANTSNHILENKGRSTGTRNRNVTVDGGIWDYNKDVNTATGGYMDGLWAGIGMLMLNVDNLTIKGIAKAGNSSKYAFLLSGITGGCFKDIHIENGSDGLHFQAPCKGIYINNITGDTDDNMVALTIGDWDNYVISEDGDFEDFYIDGIHTSKTIVTKEHVRMVGNGLSGNGKFKNIEISNCDGLTYPNPSINVLGADQSFANNYLKATYIENLTIKNVNWNPNDYSVLLNIYKHSKIKNLIFENIIANDDVVYNVPKRLILADDNLTVENLSIEKININITTSVYTALVSSTNNDIKNIHFDKCKINMPRGYVLNCANVLGSMKKSYANFANCDIYCEKLISTNSDLTAKFVNTVATTTQNAFTLNNNGKLRLEFLNTDISPLAYCKFDGVVAPAVLSVTGTCFGYGQTIDKFTPLDGDMVRALSTGEPLGIGLYYRKTNAWVKLA